MRTRLRSILIIAFALLPGVFGDKKPKMPEVSVIQFAANRSDDLILVDGKFKNVGEKPIRRMIYIIDFLATDGKQVLTTQRAEIEDEVLEPDTEAEVHGQVRSPAGATSLALRFEEAGGRALRTGKAGPYPIE
jgi:hypothetical protein